MQFGPIDRALLLLLLTVLLFAAVKFRLSDNVQSNDPVATAVSNKAVVSDIPAHEPKNNRVTQAVVTLKEVVNRESVQSDEKPAERADIKAGLGEAISATGDLFGDKFSGLKVGGPVESDTANKTDKVDGQAVRGSFLWIDRERLRSLPTSGPAWDNLKRAATLPLSLPDLSNQNDPTNVHVLAQALVYARTGEERYRHNVIEACKLAIGTEAGGRTLDLGKELAAYVLAADLVELPHEVDDRFRQWLRRVVHLRYPSGRTLISTHEQRPNNWGTFAGASRLAVAAYVGNQKEIESVATVFKGWLGDRAAYSDFRYRDRSWQADPMSPVGINPPGAKRDGHSIDGVLPDDQRRGGSFRWPPQRENYVYSALQGALVQAILLHRLGYPVWEWQDRALLRAFIWLHEQANYPAVGDDGWQPHVINYYYGTDFPAPTPAKPGKNVGWTDWTHMRKVPGEKGRDWSAQRQLAQGANSDAMD